MVDLPTASGRLSYSAGLEMRLAFCVPRRLFACIGKGTEGCVTLVHPATVFSSIVSIGKEKRKSLGGQINLS